MNKKKGLSLFLAIMIMITAIPVSSVVNAEDTVEPLSEVVASNTSYVTSSNYTVQSSSLESAVRGNLQADQPTLYNYIDMANEGNKLNGDKRWPYAAVQVKANVSGFYDISVKVSTDGRANYTKTFGMVIDGVMYPLTITKGSVASYVTVEDVYLTSDVEHTVIVTTPMPTDYKTADTTKAAWVLYAWMNVYNFKVSDSAGNASEEVKIVGAPDETEIMSSISDNYTCIEAEDSTYVTYQQVNNEGYGDAIIENTYTFQTSGTTYSSTSTITTVGPNGAVIDDTVSEEELKANGDREYQYGLKHDKNSWIQYAVEVPANAAGKYNFQIGAYVEGTNAGSEAPYGIVEVNGTKYQTTFNGSLNSYQYANLTVDLEDGINIIRCGGITKNQTCYSTAWIAYDNFKVPSSVTALEILDGEDSRILSNQFSDTTTGDFKLGNCIWDGRNNMATHKVAIDTLENDAFNHIEQISWAAINVNVAQAGSYTLAVDISPNGGHANNKIGVIVNGKASSASFAKGSYDAVIKLSADLKAGDNTIILTSALPDEKSSSLAVGDYPWFDFDSITLGSGLVAATTDMDNVKESLVSKIEAEDDTYVKYSKYDTKEANVNASNGYLMGGVSNTELMIATYDEIADYSDNKSPYAWVQYAVEAPKDGEYPIRIKSYWGYNGTADAYASVLVNGVAYKAEFKAASKWQIVSNELTVSLHAGINYIRVSSLTAEQEEVFGAGKKYINQDCLETSMSLTPVLVSELPTETETVNAWDTEKVLIKNFNTITEDIEVGGANIDTIRENRIAFDNILYNLDQLTYTALNVEAQEDGYYSISVTAKTNENTTSLHVPVIVDGTRVCKLQITQTKDKQTYGAEIALKKGTHTFMFATPMPLTKAEADALEVIVKEDGTKDWSQVTNAYPWFNFYSFTLGSGLTALAAPTEDELYEVNDTPALGDANHDGAIDGQDTGVLRKYLVGITVEINLEAADTHTDGLLDILDLVAMKKIIKNIETVPTAYLSDYNEEVAIQDSGYITTYSISELDSTTGNVITIDSEKTYRTIDGFGASFTDTSAYVLSQMNDAEQDDALRKLFSKEDGIGLSMIRNPIGASDFVPQDDTDTENHGYYTYEDTKGQFALAGGETENILKYTKRAKQLNSDVNVILSPWTAPLWMKSEVENEPSEDTAQGIKDVWQWTSASGSHLLGTSGWDLLAGQDYRSDYAQYLVKTVQAYEDKGIGVDFITPQNEPFTSNTWPGMVWNQSEDLIKFTNDYLRPKLKEAGLNTKILNLDYNYASYEDGNTIMNATQDSTEGLAFHWYGDMGPEVMESIEATYPNELIYVTEASSGRWGASTMGITDMMKKTSGIVRALRSGAQAFLSWNIAVSSEGGPTVNDMGVTQYGLLSCDLEAKDISLTKDYYALAHFSKFIDKGAKRVDSNDTGALTNYELVNVVVKNTDGSMTAVIVNSNGNKKEVCKLVDGDQVMEITLAPRSTVTITWKPSL